MNEDNPKDIDLAPHQWRSEREHPREPIFGPGLPGAIAYLFGFAVVFAATYWLRN